MNNIINTMLKRYEIKNAQEETNAIKEIIQEIILCGLSKGNFFEEAAFYGGTALRIFYGLDRFSEDLDFALIKPNKEFDLSKYFPSILKEVNSYGLNMKIVEKEKNADSNIHSAFLKGDTKEHILLFFGNDELQENNHLLKQIKIKFEVDVLPPLGATYEDKYKLTPSPHQIKLYDESSLFAGKIHAILCRNWSKRTKGRDLYDYVFFLTNNIKVNMTLLKSKLVESKYLLESDNFDIDILKKMLNRKFNEINYNDAKEDVVKFIKDVSSIELWNSSFFESITDNLNSNK